MVNYERQYNYFFTLPPFLGDIFPPFLHDFAIP
nr:MAG TPA: hypothetical protein [Crassvirales sp.]